MTRNRLLVGLTALLMALTTWVALPSPSAVGMSTARRAADASAGALHLKPKPQRIAWRKCPDPELRSAHARCGYLAVPMSYADPAGRTIRLAVSRVRHTTAHSQGVMLVNPGGPGGAGLSLATVGAGMPRHSGASYDWIGFDPRGVGASRPALSCRPNYFHGDRPPYQPKSMTDVARWLLRSKFYAQGCEKYGALLDHLTTVDNVKDMDRIRQALGVRQINFYGWSYGTYLGQVYATLFPTHVRRMVLDSTVDARRVWYAANLDQDIAFEHVFHLFCAWIARHHRAYHLGRTGAAVERLYFRQHRVLARHPARGVLGPAEWDDAFNLAGYVQAAWPQVAGGFASWVHHHDPRTLIQLWKLIDTPGNDNTFAIYTATECTDAPSPTMWSQWAADAKRLAKVAPFVTWGNVWFNAPCLYWPAKPHTPVAVNGHDVSALLVDQTFDPATPFEGSLETRNRFPRARLVEIRDGTSHATSPDLSGPCANARIAAYLKTGALPPRASGRRADVVCPALPQPRP